MTRKTKRWIGSAVAVFSCAVLLAGCAVRHLANGSTQPATAFEQMLAWNAAVAQANDGFADNVIAMQNSGLLTVPQAKAILVKQATIAKADVRLTNRIGTAAQCGAQKAGTAATSAQLDAAAASCAQLSATGIVADVNLILTTLSDLNGTNLVGVKDAAKRQALADLLQTVQTLVNKIYATLEAAGVVLKSEIEEVRPWRLS